MVTDRAERLLGRPPGPADRYDLVFADPPYAMTADTVTRMLTLLAGGWLADGALVVVERATRSGAWSGPPATCRESREDTVRPPFGMAGTAMALEE